MITTARVDIFIKSIEDEIISWNLFFSPLSTNSWLILTTIAVVISTALTVVENLLHTTNPAKMCSILNYLKNFWIALKANFGGKSGSIEKSNAHRIVLFNCLLLGSIVWMYYRASFTSHLSIPTWKLPFNDLESLSNSNYKYLVLD